jgi:hypothetical protein
MSKRTAPITAFWFIREKNKLIQCSKAEFDQAIKDGKSVKYKGYPDKKTERIAEQLETTRMAMLEQPELPTKFRQVLINPQHVINVEIIDADDPLFWEKESRLPKYQ